MQVSLTWDAPQTQQRLSVNVNKFPYIIGRGGSAQLRLDYKTISRQHVKLIDVDGVVLLERVSEGNKLFVNGRECTAVALQEGDQVQLGEIVFHVSMPAGSAPLQVLRVMWKDLATGKSDSNIFPFPVQVGRSSKATVRLDNTAVSRQQFILQGQGTQITVTPQSATNPTLINGQPITQPVLIRPGMGDVIQVGTYQIMVEIARPHNQPKEQQSNSARTAPKTTIIFNPEDDSLQSNFQRRPSQPNFPPSFFDHPVVSYNDVRRAGIGIDETTYLAVGGGFGSFIWVDNLLIYGVPPNQIKVIGIDDKPYGRYQRLCRNSQIPDNERLRSNSDSCPDNIWGWPGYAVREVWRLMGKGAFDKAFAIAFQIFMEPLVPTYTPKSGDVFSSVDEEMKRINWSNLLKQGSVRAIRKMDDGRYVVAYTDKSHRGDSQPRFMIARYLHVAVGYPGIRIVSDAETYRAETKDMVTVVNAYEQHDHIYRQLGTKGGIIILRGSGITASRILQRIDEIRRINQNPNIRILHLIRSPVNEGNRYEYAQRPVEHHWEFQPFNWPKAGWGGTLRNVLEEAPEGEKQRLLSPKVWGGTTTADRNDWREIVNRGLREGWYKIEIDTIGSIRKRSNGRLDVRLKNKQINVEVDFIIDGTGLISDITENPLLKDIVETYQLARNVQGRLKVTNHFELEGLETNRGGHIYVSGVSTLGGPYAPVDSFLGLQYTAQRSIEHLISLNAPHLRPMNFFRSFAQWMRWWQGVAP